MKAPSPLLGFNNNVRHKGRVFHIQTEDSGIRHPHIITHLFADGGRILKTTKTSYAEHIGNERLAETVRAMMQDQHKAMFIALRDGGFDYLFEDGGSGPASLKQASRPAFEALAPAAAPPGEDPPPPLPPHLPAPPPPFVAPPVVLEDVREAHPTLPAAVAVVPVVVPIATAESALPHPSQVVTMESVPVHASPPPPLKQPPPLPPRPNAMRPAAHFAPTEPAQQIVAAPPDPLEPALILGDPDDDGAPPGRSRALPQTPPQTPGGAAPPSRRRGAWRPTLDVDPGAIHGVSSSDASIDLDLDALERAAAEAQTPFFQQIQDLPPPPASVLGNKRTSTGGYSVRTPAPTPLGARVTGHETGPRPAMPPLHAPAPHAVAPSPGRYAPSRPASIFATTRPQEGSLFGENLISEKSLDEVILSYLADDLDGPAEKK